MVSDAAAGRSVRHLCLANFTSLMYTVLILKFFISDRSVKEFHVYKQNTVKEMLLLRSAADILYV